MLLARGIPFVLGEEASTLDPASWMRWQRGPLVLVLVDPTPEDRPDPDALAGAVRTCPSCWSARGPAAATRPRRSAGGWVPSSRPTGRPRTWCRH